MIEPEKFLKNSKIPQNTLNICLRAGRGGPRLKRHGGFFQIFRWQGDFWLISFIYESKEMSI